jgi:hypothetical protein
MNAGVQSFRELLRHVRSAIEDHSIEEALGVDVAQVPPEAIPMVSLPARVPRYQRAMLLELARRHESTVDEVLARELEGVACARVEELGASVLSIAAAGEEE